MSSEAEERVIREEEREGQPMLPEIDRIEFQGWSTPQLRASTVLGDERRFFERVDAELTIHLEDEEAHELRKLCYKFMRSRGIKVIRGELP